MMKRRGGVTDCARSTLVPHRKNKTILGDISRVLQKQMKIGGPRTLAPGVGYSGLSSRAVLNTLSSEVPRTPPRSHRGCKEKGVET